MPSDFSQFAPYLIVALLIFVMYRRLRRTFGRQILSPTRMTLRMGLLTVVAALLLPQALRSAAFAGATLSGAAAGVLLASWGASRTRFERAGARLYYVPHTYTGIAVSLLFLGRVLFRLLQVYQATHQAGPASAPRQPLGLNSFVSSPLTLGLFFVLVGYYVCYFGLVLWKSKHLKPDEGAPSPLGA
jgi:hypothetical protein